MEVLACSKSLMIQDPNSSKLLSIFFSRIDYLYISVCAVVEFILLFQRFDLTASSPKGAMEWGRLDPVN